MASNQFSADKLTSLAIRMKKGDRKAAILLYEELSPKTYGFFFTRTGRKETAEDLSQDIFLRLTEKVETFDENRGGFVVWFWQMARHMLVDHYRSKKATPFSAFADEEVEAMATSEEPSLENRMSYLKVQGFLKTLTEEERELFEMRYVVEMPYKEIAEVLGRSEGALRVAALRIKEKIKSKLQDEI